MKPIKDQPFHLGDDSKPYIRGRWMVTGPIYEDRSGWNLCIHKKGQCQRCVAIYDSQRDAYRAARVYNDIEKPSVNR